MIIPPMHLGYGAEMMMPSSFLPGFIVLVSVDCRSTGTHYQSWSDWFNLLVCRSLEHRLRRHHPHKGGIIYS